MEEILEELIASAGQTAYSPSPATEEELLEAQEQIFLSPPNHYRDFLLSAAHLIVGSLEPGGVSDPGARNYLPELCAAAWDVGVPRYLIVACEFDEGYYCVTQDDTVVTWSKGELNDQQWETIWEWAREVWLTS